MKPEIGSIGRYGTTDGVCICISDKMDLTFWFESRPYIDFYFFEELEIEEYIWEN